MSGGAEHEERAYVYMVRCAGGQLYTGWTNDPGARLHAHKTGKGAKATRAMGAQRFAYLERCADKSDALRREGFTEDEVEGIYFRNAMRFFEDNL